MPPRRFDSRFLLAWLSIFTAMAVASFLRAPPGPLLLLNLAFYLLAAHAALIVHEAAHALVARAVGLRPFMILAGAGPLVVDRVIGGALVQLRAVTGSGKTLFAARTPYRIRLRLLPVYAAGASVNLVIAIAVVRCSGGASRLIFSELGQRFEPWSAIFVVNAFLALTSLLPVQGKDRATGALTVSDGLRILRLPWLSEAQSQAFVDAYPILEGILLLRMERNEEALACAQAILAHDPDKHVARLQVADALLALRRYEEARVIYVELLPHPGVAVIRPLIANNAAWASVLLGRDDLLAEAARLSAEAFEPASDQAAIVGTRGSVLAQLGRLDEATPLLRRAFARNETRKNRAYNACFLAMIAARRGKAASADRWLRTAARLDPTCDLLDRARDSSAAPGATGPLFNAA